jgi:hypothetical protein
MMWNRMLVVVSALATAVFLGVLAIGLSSAEVSAGDTALQNQRSGFMSVVDGFARETLALD